MRDKSDLYFECHVTIEPVSGPRLAYLEEVSRTHGFQVATFLMLKDGTTPSSFTSARDESFSKMLVRMVDFVRFLRTVGFRVKRYKIEDTLLDSKKEGDIIGLMHEVRE